MMRIAHLSDLHFGTEDPRLCRGLVEDLNRLSPDLVVVSGDLTQRARRYQFEEARAFLRLLPQPQLAVPGNHDIPLFDLWRRFFRPLQRFQAFISDDLFPVRLLDAACVVGLNSARSFTWKEGAVSLSQINRIRQILQEQSPERLRILVIHHPIIPPPGEPESGVGLLGRAGELVDFLEECGIQLVLSGHLHQGYTGDIRSYYPKPRRSIIVAQAGTAVSRRLREQPNGFNIVQVEERRFGIEVRSWDGERFQPRRETWFDRAHG